MEVTTLKKDIEQTIKVLGSCSRCSRARTFFSDKRREKSLEKYNELREESIKNCDEISNELIKTYHRSNGPLITRYDKVLYNEPRHNESHEEFTRKTAEKVCSLSGIREDLEKRASETDRRLDEVREESIEEYTKRYKETDWYQLCSGCGDKENFFNYAERSFKYRKIAPFIGTIWKEEFLKCSAVAVYQTVNKRVKDTDLDACYIHSWQKLFPIMFRWGLEPDPFIVARETEDNDTEDNDEDWDDYEQSYDDIIEDMLAQKLRVNTITAERMLEEKLYGYEGLLHNEVKSNLQELVTFITFKSILSKLSAYSENFPKPIMYTGNLFTAFSEMLGV